MKAGVDGRCDTEGGEMGPRGVPCKGRGRRPVGERNRRGTHDGWYGGRRWGGAVGGALNEGVCELVTDSRGVGEKEEKDEEKKNKYKL